MSDPVKVQCHEHAVTLLLNRPARRNALSFALLEALSEALSSSAGPDAGAVIITGADGSFSAGADLDELQGTIDDVAMDDAIASVTTKISELPLPVIAAIDGPCLGGAMDIALSCDLRIASADAYFQVPATRFGLLYNPPAVVRMVRRLGRESVFRLLALGERLDAEAALKAGLVSEVVKTGGSLRAALAMARHASGNLPGAVAATKGLLHDIAVGEYDPGYWEERRRALLTSAERVAAVSAIKARRAGQD